MRPFYENIPFFVIFLSLFAGILTTAVHSGKTALRINLIVTAINGILNGILLFKTATNEVSFTYTMGAFPAPWGNELHAGPLESLLATTFCVVLFLSVLGGRNAIFADILPKKQNLYFIMLNMLLASLFALCYTNDVFTGYVFIEINTIAACSIVMARDCGQTIVATIRYLIMSLVGSGVFLFGLSILYSVTGHLLMPSLQDSITELVKSGLYTESLAVVAGMVCIGLCVKSALFPFHTWLPDAHGSGTTSSSAILSGLVLKGYVVLLIKFCTQVFTLQQIRTLGVNNILFVLGAAAMIFGSLQALRENHCKRMIAYSSVAQVGYIYLALGFGTTLGIAAAVFQMIAHAVTKPLLFVSAGGLIDASGHQKKLYYLCGSARRNHIAGIGFTVGALSMVGLPFFAGFSTKIAIGVSAIIGVRDWQMWTAFIVLAISSLLNAMYYLPVIFQIWKNKEEPLSPDGKALSHGAFHEGNEYFFAVISFVLLVLAFGIFYSPVNDLLALGVELL